MGRNGSGIGHIDQDQFFEVLIGVMVKVNPVIDLKPEKILFNRVEGPVFFLQLEPCLKLIDGYIDRDTKTDVGTDH